MDIIQKEAWNTHNSTHRPYETQEERRSHQSVDVTVLLRREKKIVPRSRGREGSGRDRGGGCKCGSDQIQEEMGKKFRGSGV